MEKKDGRLTKKNYLKLDGIICTLGYQMHKFIHSIAILEKYSTYSRFEVVVAQCKIHELPCKRIRRYYLETSFQNLL